MTVTRWESSTGHGGYESPAVQVSAFAAQAREAHRWAPVHSLPRTAWGVLAVALDGARSVDGARRRLYAHRLPPEVRQAAAALLYALEHPAPPADSPEET